LLFLTLLFALLLLLTAFTFAKLLCDTPSFAV
jgi:hypothetical protein